MAQVAYSVQDLIGQAVGTEAQKEDTDVLFYPSRNKARTFIYQLVMYANELYGSQIRVGDHPGVKFVIGKIEAVPDRYCNQHPQDMRCHIRTENTAEGGERFIELLSKKDLRNQCLHYVITNRSFGPVQGIAYVQGVCSSG